MSNQRRARRRPGPDFTPVDRPPIDELRAAADVLRTSPIPTVVVSTVPPRIVWANRRFREITGAPEWTEIDFSWLVASGEREIARVRFEEFARTLEPYSIVRNLVFRGRETLVRNHYWPLEGTDGRYAVVTTEYDRARVGRTIAEWLDDWPQPCALVHRNYGVQHVNRTLRALLGLDDPERTGALWEDVRATLSTSEIVARLADDPSELLTLDVRTGDGGTRRFLVASAPLPADVDPQLVLLVGHTHDLPAELPVPDVLAQLTPRERDVARLLLAGHRVGTIAEDLFLSTHTVRNHLRTIFRKVGVTSQGELVRRMRGD